MDTALIKALIPPLTGNNRHSLSTPPMSSLDANYKGDMGRIAVVGGCREYSGAPYFAAISALRVGADLSHVFTTATAAPIIKSYSPELIVHQSLYETEQQPRVEAAEKLAVEEVSASFDRLDALVVGPGLGRDPLLHQCVRGILMEARDRQLPVVVDADALYLVSQGNPLCNVHPDGASDRSIVSGYPHAILTPNVNELRRLARGLDIPHEGLSPQDNDQREKITVEVARRLDGPTVISKGSIDYIAQSDDIVHCLESSSPRRCGGQGDILSGVAGVFASWSRRLSLAAPMMLAGFVACVVTRRAGIRTFQKRGRSMVASDVLLELSPVLDAL